MLQMKLTDLPVQLNTCHTAHSQKLHLASSSLRGQKTNYRDHSWAVYVLVVWNSLAHD